MIGSLIALVIVLVVVCCIFAVIVYAIDNLVPDPIKRFVHVGVIIIWALVVLLILYDRLLPLASQIPR